MYNTIRRIFKKIVAMLIVLILTLVDLSWVGVNLVSYAVDTIGTNNQNVEYNVYLDTSSQLSEVDADKKEWKYRLISGEDIKIGNSLKYVAGLAADIKNVEE